MTDPFFFIQMADPQFGMFASFSGLDEQAIAGYRQRDFNVKPAPKTTGFADENRLYERAIAEANRLRPDFVVMCGDMVHEKDDPAQLAEVQRITGMLDSAVPIHWTAGNHDVGEAPTDESLATYRDRYGPDNYSFDHGGSRFIVLNSSICYDPSNVPHEWEKQIEFLRSELAQAESSGWNHTVVFMHYPPFIRHPDEDDSWIVLPRDRRQQLLAPLKEQGVSFVFTGHWHRNNSASDGGLHVVATGPVGYPLGQDPSGFRIVKVLEDRIEHEYFGFDDMPATVDLG